MTVMRRRSHGQQLRRRCRATFGSCLARADVCGPPPPPAASPQAPARRRWHPPPRWPPSTTPSSGSRKATRRVWVSSLRGAPVLDRTAGPERIRCVQRRTEARQGRGWAGAWRGRRGCVLCSAFRPWTLAPVWGASAGGRRVQRRAKGRAGPLGPPAAARAWHAGTTVTPDRRVRTGSTARQLSPIRRRPVGRVAGRVAHVASQRTAVARFQQEVKVHQRFASLVFFCDPLVCAARRRAGAQAERRGEAARGVCARRAQEARHPGPGRGAPRALPPPAYRPPELGLLALGLRALTRCSLPSLPPSLPPEVCLSTQAQGVGAGRTTTASCANP